MENYLNEYKKGPFLTGFTLPAKNDANGMARLTGDILEIVEELKEKSLANLGAEYRVCKKIRDDALKSKNETPYNQLFCAEVHRSLKKRCETAEKSGNITDMGTCDVIFRETPI